MSKTLRQLKEKGYKTHGTKRTVMRSSIRRKMRDKAYRTSDGRYVWQGWGLKFLCVPGPFDTGSHRLVRAFGVVNLVKIKLKRRT